jgi:hypothetical protein
MKRIPWNEQQPRHFEVDVVHGCGISSSGHYVRTIQMVDVATGWTEQIATLGRSYTVMELLESEHSIPEAERGADTTELYIAEEAFFCGAAMEIAATLCVDRYSVGQGKIGYITARVERLYERMVRSEQSRYQDALLLVYAPAGPLRLIFGKYGGPPRLIFAAAVSATSSELASGC